ncbi:hypothetical protein lerEdw1_007015 [Lerista edwardsae]|nr:hypothetical protein lerEdw1_007015 [Lerista edwardsae]
MEDTNHKSLENPAVSEPATVLSTETMPWDSIGVSSKNNIMSAGQYSEEHVLTYTFKACDPEQTGEVSVFRIIEFLQEMTGQNCEDWRFQSLYKRLDPEERGITVDFPTFHTVMKDWITDCRQDGEEAADLMNSIQDLQHGNKQLAVQNIKLQRTIEAAEELNSKLSEEIFELKGKLRGSQQALEQAKALGNELDDLKFFSKNLEEENSKLHTQARQLEKEQQILCVQVDNLHEENKKLLLEKESSKCKIKELFTENTKMQFQLCEYENRISSKETELNEKVKQTEELTVALEEYRMVVQELKVEVNRLQDQLCRSYKDLEIMEEQTESSLRSEYMGNKMARMAPKRMWSCLSNKETQVITQPGKRLHVPSHQKSKHFSQQSRKYAVHVRQHVNCLDVIGSCSSSPEAALQEHALVPVHRELIPIGRKKPYDNWFGILIERFLEFHSHSLFLHILQKLVLSGLLVACISLLAIFYFVLPYSQHPVWFEPKGTPSPHFQLRYLQTPPV